MNGNLDAALSSLADEINALEADRKEGNQSKQIAMGHKLIAVRELLRARNGILRRPGRPNADGSTPNGWVEWVKANLSISYGQACRCIQFAIDPEGQTKLNRLSAKAAYFKPKTYVSRVIKSWPMMDDEQKQRLVNFCFERYNEERTQP